MDRKVGDVGDRGWESGDMGVGEAGGKGLGIGRVIGVGEVGGRGYREVYVVGKGSG